jgi:hypothetical protein
MCHALHLVTHGPCGSYPRKPDRAITSGLPTNRELATLITTSPFVGTNPENAANF